MCGASCPRRFAGRPNCPACQRNWDGVDRGAALRSVTGRPCERLSVFGHCDRAKVPAAAPDEAVGERPARMYAAVGGRSAARITVWRTLG
jgi:hypothetical protein